MAKSIVARRKGDEYQARVFWLKLLELRTGDYVKAVTFESDQVSFVDDVVVTYSQPILDRLTGAREVVRELIQCKYHMTQHDAFAHDNLIDPDFINCRHSMLKRLYDAFLELSDDVGTDAFRLCIFSNWHWDHQDEIARHMHEEMIRPTFYKGGKRSAVGRVRSKLANHLCISEDELRAFLGTVRFALGKNLVDLAKEMEPRLRLAGLLPIDISETNIVYDDLAWKLFNQGRNSFERGSFDVMVREENLIASPSTEHSEISIQSFLQFARRPHDLQAAHLDLCHFFCGRFPKNASYWRKEIPEHVSTFMLDKGLCDLPQPVHLFFDCHLSIAFFSGALMSPKHGIQIIPTQRTGNDHVLWEPTTDASTEELWEFEIVGNIKKEMVLGISVTHPIENHLNSFLEKESLNDLPRILALPSGGVGPNAITCGDQAWQLGFQLAGLLREKLPNACQKIHLFVAVPVALGYILGYTLRHVTPHIQLYEHDFEGISSKRRYYPSLLVPHQTQP